MSVYHRASSRRAVTLRADYATPEGRLWLGLLRNLSLHGLYLESVGGQGSPELTLGDQLTITFVLPSGHPCKLRATVMHGDRQGCGVELWQVPSPSLPHLYRYWDKMEWGRLWHRV